jgi:hypothetical protein
VTERCNSHAFELWRNFIAEETQLAGMAVVAQSLGTWTPALTVARIIDVPAGIS